MNLPSGRQSTQSAEREAPTAGPEPKPPRSRPDGRALPPFRVSGTWGPLAVALALALHTAPSACATLILTALCNDGVVIRSDKRNTIKHRSGQVEYRDVLEKVFATGDRRIILYNHGINVINRVSWREHAATVAAKLQESAATDLDTAMGIVEASLAPHMAAELARNQLDHFSAFVLIMRTKDGSYRAGEVSWRKDQDVAKKPLGRFILSGSGKKFCRRSDAQKLNDHWARLTVEQAKAEIGLMYDEAVKRQTDAQGQAFSREFDELAVTAE